jgi:hypothetical protein
MTMAATSPIDSVWTRATMRCYESLPAWHCTCNYAGVMRGNVTTSWTIGVRGARCSLSWWEVVSQWLNWQCQLCNGWGVSNNDNSDDDNNNNNAEMTTTKTASTAAGNVGINAETDTAAALHQGLTTQDKCIRL